MVSEIRDKKDEVETLYHHALSRNILISKEALEFILFNGISLKKVKDYLNELPEGILSVDNLKELIQQTTTPSDQVEFEVLRTSTKHLAKNYEGSVKDIWTFNTDFESKTSVDNFLNYFRDRYKKIKSLLLQRNGVKNIVSIEKLKSHTFNESVSIIAMIREKDDYGKGSLRFLIEDDTDEIIAYVDEKIYDVAKNVVEDDVIALKGKLNASKKYFIVEEIFYPDIPLPTNDSITKIEDPLTAAFISDLHFGSAQFIEKAMTRFLKWINSDDKDASRLKYLFILGDNVDGVGIYPDQEKELLMKNIYDQYKAFEEFLLKIPEHIEIIVIPGNHDAVRLAEPQPILPEKYLENAHKMKNIHFKTNPAFVEIHGRDSAKGIKVLMYHGYSFNALIDTLTDIRKVARDKPTVVMKEILKRRHLAPIYGSTLIAPKEIDNHVIDVIPDIFASGDLHSHDVSNYKGVTLISASTWQAQTSFQDRVGHVANPGKLTIVDLQQRNTRVIDLLG
ncbi:MAG: DNA-directed DNA polymerase II small subunit [Candidatus Nanohaloarchaeota archaeon]|nr:DNA-directed DNA polymerase II small subunit [Candidatus Nanohaloarchaeota archaeon]